MKRGTVEIEVDPKTGDPINGSRIRVTDTLPHRELRRVASHVNRILIATHAIESLGLTVDEAIASYIHTREREAAKINARLRAIECEIENAGRVLIR